MSIYSNNSLKLSAGLKVRASSYYRAIARLNSLASYNEATKENLIVALKELDDAVAELTPYFPYEFTHFLEILVSERQKLYLDGNNFDESDRKRLVISQTNIDLALHAAIENYDKNAQTSLANLDEWVEMKNKELKKLMRETSYAPPISLRHIPTDQIDDESKR